MSTVKKKSSKRKSVLVLDQFAALNDIGDPWSSRASRLKASQDMREVYDMALGHLGQYGESISDACSMFSSYTQTRIENIDMEDIERNVLKGAFAGSLSLLNALIPDPTGLSKIGKFVLHKIREGLVDLLLSAKFDGEIDKDRLKQVVRRLAESAMSLKWKWKTSRPGGSPDQTTPPLKQLSALVSSLESNLSGNARIAVDTDSCQSEFLAMFYDTNTDEMGALLSYFYAIPTPEEGARKAQLLYERLLHRFSKIYGYAAAKDLDRRNHLKDQPSRVTSLAVDYQSDGFRYWREHRQ